MNPGSIVRCRNRDWVLLPSDQSELYRLRPLTGATDEVVAIHRRLADLMGMDLPAELLASATFPLPSSDDVADAASAHLLWQPTRLTLREGATPFRSLGRISIRPRVYQFVPLLMALRLAPVRLLIADDVGVGKTIEALLVARELLDRGEIKRLCVLCPPYLCEQWQRELSEKFNLESVVIRAGTVSQLERRKPGTDSIYRYYPVQVASIDFVKSDRNKHLFLLDCPELVIVDEAHGVATVAERNHAQHQRHQLVRELATAADRHLIMLTATPHSGIESAFRSLLSLIHLEFGNLNTTALAEPNVWSLPGILSSARGATLRKTGKGSIASPSVNHRMRPIASRLPIENFSRRPMTSARKSFAQGRLLPSVTSAYATGERSPCCAA